MLDSTVESVTSALKRARASLQRRLPPTASANRRPLPTHPPSRRWWRSSSARTSPATSTGWSPCSPTTSASPCHRFPSNTTAATRWPASSPAVIRRAAGYDLVPTRANGQPAFGAYLRAPTGGIRHGTGLLRPHAHRRPDLRRDPLRQQRARMVRAAAIIAWPIAVAATLGWCGDDTTTQRLQRHRHAVLEFRRPRLRPSSAAAVGLPSRPRRGALRSCKHAEHAGLPISPVAQEFWLTGSNASCIPTRSTGWTCPKACSPRLKRGRRRCSG